jgi:ABC-type polysaccharide/polyol phosphate transport system ATPase subunit
MNIINKKPQINLENVTKEFFLQGDRTFKELIPNLIRGKKWGKNLKALDNLSFKITPGESVGIIGHNGAGKSTIMKLIAGVTYPTVGEVTVVGRVAPLIELGAGFHYELNGYENIYLNGAILGMHKKEIELELENIIEFSEIKDFLNEPLKHLSTGMIMRLAFSIAVHARAQIFLIDEVLAVGDLDFQKKCLLKLNEIKNQKDKIVVFISHDETSVRKFCDRAILLEHGKLLLDDTPENVYSQYNTEDLS